MYADSPGEYGKSVQMCIRDRYKGYHVDKWITLWITLCWVDFLFENLNRIPDGIRGFYLRRNFFGTVKDGGMIAAS